ncbi:hypothetical protein BZG36_00397 [Bifiguratus adelaidae]|uniref:50S ribosomal protein L35 n=1 Tax=Bifiguratus adelaidae TaxID=1938954 RepID=A0A261Y845_9FUNG|nr:hypothetical protein BZG36_00397 [Bifiguratus adelaidae]
MSQKLKTHSGAKKRFMPTSKGNFKRWHVGRRHLNLSLSPERSNRLAKSALADSTQKQKLRRLMPYA